MQASEVRAFPASRASSSDVASQCLSLVLAVHGRPTDARRIQRDFGTAGVVDSVALVRAAREFGCKSKLVRTRPERLSTLPTPCVVEGADGGFFVLARVDDTGALIHVPGRAPARITMAALSETIGAQAVLVRPRRHAATPTHFGLSWFVPALMRYKRLLLEVLGASFVLQLFALASPLFFQVIVDKVLVHGALTTLDVLVVALVAVTIFDALLGALRTYVFAHTMSRVDVELGAGLFKHLLALPLAYFQSRATGQTVARVRELENVRNFLTNSATTVVIDFLFVGLFLVVMYAYSPALTAIVAATFPLYVVISLVVTPVLRTRIEQRFQCAAANQSFLVESVSGMETIKSLSVEGPHRGQFEELLARYTRASFRANTTGVIGSQAVGFVGKLGTVVVLWFGARLVIEGSMSVGQLVAFNMLAGRVAGPVVRMAQLWQDLQQFRLSVARLGDVLNTPTEHTAVTNTPSLQRLRGDISFDEVRFSYGPEQREVLRGLSLQVKAGERVGIVGASGSGKSTLTKLVQRLHVPGSGRVLLDDHDVGQLDAQWLRQQIGVVLQESVLFSSSVRDNIAMTMPHVSMEHVIDAAKLAGAHDFIIGLPNGYDTVLEERGSNLSGGQRQRIAIARALLSDPRIVIFDEATSALDYESERIVQSNMRKIARGRTVIVVAHRLSTVRHADRIVVVEDGRVLESGTHEQLIRGAGRYASLWQSQVA